METNQHSPVSFWEQCWLDKADIVIIGAGIVGLQTSIRLKEKFPHRKVWILESSHFGSPASLRNAGFACFGSLGELLDDYQRIGSESALNLYAMRYCGLQKLIEEFGETQIGYEPCGGYEVFDSSATSTYDDLVTNMHDVNQALEGIHGKTSFIEKTTGSLSMNVYGKAIFSPLEGAIQSHLLVETIRRKAISLGVELYSGLQVSTIVPLNSGKHEIIFSNSGIRIIANDLVLCSNGFTKQFMPELEVNPARGQVWVTKPIPSLAFRGIFHYNMGYVYFRSLGSRILIGGGRNLNFTEETTWSQHTSHEIEAYIKGLMTDMICPGIEIGYDYSWGGTMGMAVDRQPIIQQLDSHLYCCVRMGGMGVAIGSIAAEKVANLVE